MDNIEMNFENYLTEGSTYRSDVNEILLAYYCNFGSWDNFQDSEYAKSVLEDRKKKLKKEEFSIEKERAIHMAGQIMEWAPKNGYVGEIIRVWWLSRKGLSDVFDVEDHYNPSDIVLQFKNRKYLGISAKSTNGNRQIVFRNPGLGSVEKELNLKLKKIQDREESKFIEKYNLSNSAIKRREQIKGNQLILSLANDERTRILNLIRNSIFKKLNILTQSKLRSNVIEFWMGLNVHDAPKLIPYIKVTGHGINGEYHVTITDPKNDIKVQAAQTQKISVMKSGNETITIKAGDVNVLRIRAKYGSVPLAAPIEFSVDPWSTKSDGFDIK